MMDLEGAPGADRAMGLAIIEPGLITEGLKPQVCLSPEISQHDLIFTFTEVTAQERGGVRTPQQGAGPLQVPTCR
jgi:hypothetical protein